MAQLATEYGEDEFLYVDYHTAYGLNCPASNVRKTYYSVSSVPHVFFDGYDGVLGAGSNAYSVYHPIVVSHLAGQAKLSIDAEVYFDEAANYGEVNIDLEVASGETITEPSACRIRTVIYENNVPYGTTTYDHIVRSMLSDVILTAANGGEHQIFTLPITVPDSLNASELNAVVFVQRDTNKHILNAAKADLMYNAELSVPSTVASVMGTEAAVFAGQVTYTGTTPGDVVVSLDETSLPAGWDAELVWDSVTYPSTFTIPGMTPSQVEDFEVHTTSDGSPGLATVTLSMQPQLGPVSEAELVTFSNTQAVLVVNDTGGDLLATYFTDAITGSGHYYLLTDVTEAEEAGASLLSPFDVVVWMTGAMQIMTLTTTDQDILMDYLDGGGSLFLSSHGFLTDQGVTTFGTDYLGVASWNDDTGTSIAVGVGGDPIGDGLNLTVARIYSDYTDDLTPGGGAAAWLNGSHGPIGIRNDGGDFRTAFMSMSFEFISSAPADPNNRNGVMGRILDWLSPLGASDVRPVTAAVPGGLMLAQNAPNPFRTTTSLQFSIPGESLVSLAVYNIAGRKVVDLLNRSLAAGSYTVRWDGRDAGGRAVASGVYLYRLQAGAESTTKEMVLRR